MRMEDVLLPCLIRAITKKESYASMVNQRSIYGNEPFTVLNMAILQYQNSGPRQPPNDRYLEIAISCCFDDALQCKGSDQRALYRESHFRTSRRGLEDIALKGTFSYANRKQTGMEQDTDGTICQMRFLSAQLPQLQFCRISKSHSLYSQLQLASSQPAGHRHKLTISRSYSRNGRLCQSVNQSISGQVIIW